MAAEADNTFMAENRRSRTNNAEPPPDEPLLRQGRPADPVPAEMNGPDAAQAARDQSSEKPPAQTKQPELAGSDSGAGEPVSESGETAEEAAPDGDNHSAGIEKTIAESRQRKLRLLLRQCDRVMLMDFEILAMSDWPDNYSVAVARRSRDLWLFSSLLAAIIFLSGMTGFVPAWIAGGGFGVFIILLLSGLPAVRGMVTRKPSYLDLIMKRRRMLRDARKHIEHLEGSDGLVWQCARMAEFNTALRGMRFSELLALSERRELAEHLTRREHVRLYLIYLLEAEKAYSRAEKEFFERHQQALDKGWESVASSSGGSA